MVHILRLPEVLLARNMAFDKIEDGGLMEFRAL